jgi:hypothetical protein
MLNANDFILNKDLIRCPFPVASFAVGPLPNVKEPDPPSGRKARVSENSMKKVSLQELSEEYSKVSSVSDLIHSKTGINHLCCLSKQIEDGKSENQRLLLEYQELENVFHKKMSAFEEEKEAAKKVENDLNLTIFNKEEDYSEIIRGLNAKLNVLNNRLSLYEDFLKLSVKKSKEEYICTANPGLSELVFSFKFKGALATYTPIKVNFDAHDMLSFTLSNITNKEISMIFNRLQNAYIK